MKKIFKDGRILSGNFPRQLFLTMKLTLFLLITSALGLFATGSYSQNTRVTLELKSVTVKQALKAIENSSEFFFIYNNELINVDRLVDLSVKDEKITDVLGQLFDSNVVEVTVIDRKIVLSPASMGEQQERKVSGKISDRSGVAIPGATVIVKGTTKGVTTDSRGNYSLSIPADAKSLQISFIGMKTEEITIGGKSEINVILAEETILIDEVVAVGYGSQKKSEVTSSISQIKGDDIKNSSASNVVMSLQGRASGVEMITAGEPGSVPSIRIRGIGTIGNAEPLYVLDGVPVDAEVLAQLSQTEIQSVEILKDAASGAIYGTRAANGVILITTNRAKYNQVTTMQLNASTGFNSVIKKYPVTTGEQLYQLKRERYTMDGLPIPDNVPWSDPYYNATRTNWQDEFFQNGVFKDYNMRVSGGTEKSTYNTNVFYRNEEGTEIDTYFKRIGISFNATHKITKKLKIEESIRVSRTNDQLQGQPGQGDGTSITLYSAYRFQPAVPLKYPDGNWGSGKASTELGDMWNPIYKATHEWQNNFKLNTLVNFRADYEITHDLTLTGRAAYQQMNSKFEAFQDVTPLQSRSEINPSLTKNTSETSFMLGEIFLSYNKKIGKHNISAVAGTSAQENKGEWLNMRGEIFTSVARNQLVMNNAGLITGSGSSYPSTALASGFIRGNYNYNDIYYLSTIFRADGSSRFADGKRWGYFPSISGGWRLTGEEFMKGIEAISNLKLNVGWGQLGNQNVNPFQYLSTFVKDQRYIFDGNKLTGTRLAAFANPNITWETTATTNVLLETAFLKNSIHLNVAWFNRKTSNMLIPEVAQGTAGLVQIPDSNIGEMNNKGFEIEPSYNGNIGKVSFNIGMNMTLIKNKVTKLYGKGKFIGGGVTWGGLPVTRTFEGEPISSFYGWKTAGIYQTQAEIDSDPNISSDNNRANITPGDVRFVDVNGDHKVDENDRVHIGDANPHMLLGFNLDLGYKGFSFSAVFSGAYGHKVYNAMMMRGMDPTQAGNMDAIAWQRWTGPGTSNKWPRMSTIRANDNYRNSDLGIQSGDYMRLKDIVLGYTIPKGLTEKLGVGKVKFYVTGRNLLTFTNYYGVDPEESGANPLQRGIIFNNYPQSKSVVFGVDVTF